MRIDALVLKTGAFRGLLTGAPENLGGDWVQHQVLHQSS